MSSNCGVRETGDKSHKRNGDVHGHFSLQAEDVSLLAGVSGFLCELLNVGFLYVGVGV
jgi:hypothetical protein